jgi:Fe-S-cluster containining protein
MIGAERGHHALSEIEIQFIETNSKKRRGKTLLPKGDFHGTACPLLKNNECSVYEARPYVCRRHHSLAPDSQWCAPYTAFEKDFARVEFSELERAFENLQAGSTTMDIRQVFTRD